MPKIVISEFMDDAAIATLRAHHDVHLDESLCERPGELAAALTDAAAIIVRNRTQVTADLIAGAANLKAVGRLGVGLDNIDLAACKAGGIAVLPAVGANAASVAEYVLCTAMLLLRTPALFGTADLVAGKWPRAALSRGREIAGKTVALIGFGSIGQTTGDLARAAGFATIAHDDYLDADHPAWKTTARANSLDEMLSTADVVSLHCPLTEATRGLIGAQQLAVMKSGAILINTARGGIVDEAALADALRSGHLGGAAIDVFANEPVDKATGELFAGLDNIILTPHVAGVTIESNERISSMTAENVLRVLKEANS
ncbi:MAG: hydroxyacid dehydrogenase [Alphaproteobacteria bacterium]|nr:hydroxyacid dehydrogenase [Alphaproteobacteria bacterium]